MPPKAYHKVSTYKLFNMCITKDVKTLGGFITSTHWDKMGMKKLWDGTIHFNVYYSKPF